MKSSDMIAATTQASALLLLEMLRTQSNCGWDWQTARCMEPALASLAPVRKQTVETLYDDVHVRDVVYVFSISKAQELLRTVGYTEFLQDLMHKPYHAVQGTFIRKCGEYAQSERFYQR